MIKETQFNEIKNLISGFFTGRNIDLIDIFFRYEGKNLILNILADRPEGGITLGDCAALNKGLRDLLAESQIIPADYALEVSSPGLDRPLKSKKDFLRYLGRLAVFFLNDLIEGKCQWEGVIKEAGEASVFIEVAGKVLEIPFNKINKAKLVV